MPIDRLAINWAVPSDDRHVWETRVKTLAERLFRCYALDDQHTPPCQRWFKEY